MDYRLNIIYIKSGPTVDRAQFQSQSFKNLFVLVNFIKCSHKDFENTITIGKLQVLL